MSSVFSPIGVPPPQKLQLNLLKEHSKKSISHLSIVIIGNTNINILA